ncbi:MAG: hypothetical protein KDD19_21615 [Phaeodactylibacter sp.]|nr:hypothetical protein [Phaeodactylibacter sp.]MCB9049342.1 hypothetical protein [Lewinellaceae bacterium]
MKYQKSEIRQLIENGKLQEACNTAVQYAEYCGLTDIVNALTVIGSNLQEHQNTWSLGLISHSEFSVQYARIAHGLAMHVSQLPDVPRKGSNQRQLLRETTFKNRVFFALCLTKAAAFLWLWRHYSSGGFNVEQFQSTTILLLPALAAYITVILNDYLRQHQAGPDMPRYVAGPIVTFAYFLFPLYAISLLYLIASKAGASISFVQMNFGIGVVESVLGGYIGKIVSAFFTPRP